MRLVGSKKSHLEKLLDDHCLLEERDIFPWAVATYKKSEASRYEEEICPICKTRIDEFGWCACDTIGGD